MKTIKGPAIFLAQFAADAPPFNSLRSIGQWAASLGFVGVQLPSWDARFFDLARAAQSQTYCDEVTGTLRECGVGDDAGDKIPRLGSCRHARQHRQHVRVLGELRVGRGIGEQPPAGVPVERPDRLPQPGGRRPVIGGERL